MDPLSQPMLGQERVPTSHFHQAVLAPHKHLRLPISRQPGRCVSLPQLIASTCLSLKATSRPACLRSGKGIKERTHGGEWVRGRPRGCREWGLELFLRSLLL